MEDKVKSLAEKTARRKAKIVGLLAAKALKDTKIVAPVEVKPEPVPEQIVLKAKKQTAEQTAYERRQEALRIRYLKSLSD